MFPRYSENYKNQNYNQGGLLPNLVIRQDKRPVSEQFADEADRVVNDYAVPFYNWAKDQMTQNAFLRAGMGASPGTLATIGVTAAPLLFPQSRMISIMGKLGKITNSPLGKKAGNGIKKVVDWIF